MDTKFVISQLVTAVITIITTIIVVRYSLKGSLGVSQETKSKMKRMLALYAVILFNLAYFGVVLWRLISLVRQDSTPTRLDVLFISLFTIIVTVYISGAAALLTYKIIIRLFRRLFDSTHT
jgi:hypothetical protein